MKNPYKRICVQGLELAYGPMIPGPQVREDVYMHSCDNCNFVNWKDQWYVVKNVNNLIETLIPCNTETEIEYIMQLQHMNKLIKSL